MVVIFRQLKKSDYKEYIELMDTFRPIGLDVSKEEFEKIYDNIFKNNIIFVAEDNNEIISTAKLIIDQKFIHNFAKYGFIEDVIVKKEKRGQNNGKNIINHIIDYCKEQQFYKITLTCNNELVAFYEKTNFKIYQNHMSQLL